MVFRTHSQGRTYILDELDVQTTKNNCIRDSRVGRMEEIWQIYYTKSERFPLNPSPFPRRTCMALVEKMKPNQRKLKVVGPLWDQIQCR